MVATIGALTGKRLKELRLKKRLTQDELAIALTRQYGKTISQGDIGSYERGQLAMGYRRARRIAQFFGVSTAYLLGETDDE